MLYDEVRELPLSIDSLDLARRERDTSSGFTRVTTVWELRSDEGTGRGEDVTYDADDHDALAAEPPALPVPFEGTFGGFSASLDDVDLFPVPPEREASRHYRRWGIESAALDLALRQAGTDLASALGRSYDPVRFLVSTRLGDPPSTDRVASIRERYPGTEFKLDPTGDWSPDVVQSLADTGAVRTLDLKGAYHGTSVDQPPDPDLYRLVLEAFPDAIVEDPAFTDETRPLFDGEEHRVSWDAPVTGVESIRELPFEPHWINVKPSRFGTVASLLESIEHCLERGIRPYGGGQFELGVGREHVQALASLFYPEAPNDVAPGGYNDPEVSPGLPTSPLPPPSDPTGLDWR